MTTEFRLEIFFEQDQDKDFAEKEAEKLCALVRSLAPHIHLRIEVRKASAVYARTDYYQNEGKCWAIDVHDPIEKGSQTLMISRREIGAEGRAGPEKGCLNKERMEAKGEDSAELTIHEWIHTISGKEINGRTIPNPDDAERCGFHIERNGRHCYWHSWFKHILRENP